MRNVQDAFEAYLGDNLPDIAERVKDCLPARAKFPAQCMLWTDTGRLCLEHIISTAELIKALPNPRSHRRDTLIDTAYIVVCAVAKNNRSNNFPAD